ncbi:MAG TPA: hypothetical protein VN441_10920 [Syntrophomonas sp.]|nr:hypothetical protein [Syntrophomonas sp.]
MVTAEKIAGKRYEIKALVEEMEKNNPDVDKRILAATQNVNLDCLLGWQRNGEKHAYLDDYDQD